MTNTTSKPTYHGVQVRGVNESCIGSKDSVWEYSRQDWSRHRQWDIYKDQFGNECYFHYERTEDDNW